MPETPISLHPHLRSRRLQMDADHPVQWEAIPAAIRRPPVARPYPGIPHALALPTGIRWHGRETLTWRPRQTKRIQKIDWNVPSSANAPRHAAARQRLGFGQPRPRLPGFGRGQPLGMGRRIRSREGRRRRRRLRHGGSSSVAADGEQRRELISREGGRRTSRARAACGLDPPLRRTRSGSWTASVNEVTRRKASPARPRSPQLQLRSRADGHLLPDPAAPEIETASQRAMNAVRAVCDTTVTVARAYRWREFIRRGFARSAICRSHHVSQGCANNFAHSDVPPGRPLRPAGALHLCSF